MAATPDTPQNTSSEEYRLLKQDIAMQRVLVEEELSKAWNELQVIISRATGLGYRVEVGTGFEFKPLDKVPLRATLNIPLGM